MLQREFEEERAQVTQRELKMAQQEKDNRLVFYDNIATKVCKLAACGIGAWLVNSTAPILLPVVGVIGSVYLIAPSFTLQINQNHEQRQMAQRNQKDIRLKEIEMQMHISDNQQKFAIREQQSWTFWQQDHHFPNSGSGAPRQICM